jgi:hypothetical protein
VSTDPQAERLSGNPMSSKILAAREMTMFMNLPLLSLITPPQS